MIPYWNFAGTAMAYATMLAQAQTVIAYRMLGLFGILAASPNENSRMVMEKGPAFAKANSAAMTALLQGKSVDAVADAWVRPIGARTRANARRLTRTR